MNMLLVDIWKNEFGVRLLALELGCQGCFDRVARFVLDILANDTLMHCLFEFDTSVMVGKARQLEVT